MYFIYGFIICFIYTVLGAPSESEENNEDYGVVIEAGDGDENQVCNRGNEMWDDCGSACPRTCEDPDPKPCIKMCNPGCMCLEGFVRDETSGRCIPLIHCNSVFQISHGECLGEHEEWLDCGTACPKTCEFPKSRACTRQCVPGCYCKHGLLRDTLTGRCLSRCY